MWRRPFRQTFVGFLLLRKVSFGAFLITLPLDACVLFAGRSTPPGMDRGPDPPPEETSVSPGAGGRDRPFGDSAARACPGRPEPDNSIGVGLRQWEFLRSIACAGASSASSGVRAGGASPGGVGWGARLRPEGASRKARAAPPPCVGQRTRVFAVDFLGRRVLGAGGGSFPSIPPLVADDARGPAANGTDRRKAYGPFRGAACSRKKFDRCFLYGPYEFGQLESWWQKLFSGGSCTVRRRTSKLFDLRRPRAPALRRAFLERAAGSLPGFTSGGGGTRPRE